MNEARKAGIKVITWDADGTRDSRDLFVNQSTPEAIGFGMVDAMARDLGGAAAASKVLPEARREAYLPRISRPSIWPLAEWRLEASRAAMADSALVIFPQDPTPS